MRNLRSFLGSFSFVRKVYSAYRNAIVGFIETKYIIARISRKLLRVLAYTLLIPRFITESDLNKVALRLTPLKNFGNHFKKIKLSPVQYFPGGPGISSNDNPHPFFDGNQYRNSYKKELSKFSGTPYEHYIAIGRRKGLSPGGIQAGPNAKEQLPTEFVQSLTFVETLIFEHLFNVSLNSYETGQFSPKADHDRIHYLSNQEARERIAILVPFFENWDLTVRCLNALDKCWDVEMTNVFLVDDGSSTNYESAAKELHPDVSYLRNEENLGYLRVSNWAFSKIISSGKFDYVFLLNNDTSPLGGFLAECLFLMETTPKAGIVGSKLVYPDGLIQEAGGIVWRDGSAWIFGRYTRPSVETEYSREVDYCSAASVLVRIEAVQGELFDNRYYPAYYEDTDLAFRVREGGWKVLYCPGSTVIHYEGRSHGTDISAGPKRYQLSNQPIFETKWKSRLSENYPRNPELAVIAANRIESASRDRTIIWVDSQLPHPLRDSGSIRTIRLIQLAREIGYFIVFVEMFSSDVSKLWLSSQGVPVAKDFKEAERFLFKLGRVPEKVWISRVTNFSSVSKKVRKLFPAAETIFDTVDLHFIRLEREAILTGKKVDYLSASRTRTAELKAMGEADHTVVVSEWEKTFLENEYGIPDVAVVSNVQDVEEDFLPQEHRKGLVFVGSFAHHPNESGIKWFLTEIWPLLDSALQEEGIDIVGQLPPAWLTAMNSNQIRVHGWVPDSKAFVRTARFSVAPLLVGAGVKGKIGEAIQCGTCVVTTSVGAEGMGLVNGESAIVSDNPMVQAEQMNRLAPDSKRRERLVNESINQLRIRTSSEVARNSLSSLLG